MSPKTVLITGCSEGGIGDALAQSFHRRGLRVFATARNLAKVQHLEKMGMTILQLDVADASSRKQAVEYVNEATGGTLVSEQSISVKEGQNQQSLHGLNAG
jgi:1-acylglycerone phosphate reductase